MVYDNTTLKFLRKYVFFDISDGGVIDFGHFKNVQNAISVNGLGRKNGFAEHLSPKMEVFFRDFFFVLCRGLFLRIKKEKYLGVKSLALYANKKPQNYPKKIRV